MCQAQGGRDRDAFWQTVNRAVKFVMYFVDEFGEEFYGSVVGDNGQIIQSEYFDMINIIDCVK